MRHAVILVLLPTMALAQRAMPKPQREDLLRRMQEVMGPLPGAGKRVALEPKVEREDDLGQLVRRKMTIAVEPGDRLPFYLFVPKAANGRLPAVICLHQTSRALGKNVPAGLGEPADQHYALELAERGFVTLAPDYVNMGEYKFDPYAHGYASATMKGIWNHMRCVDYLQSLPEVDGRRIGAIGHSLGGHNAIFLAVFDERIRCIVSSCGFCSFRRYMNGDLTGWSHDGYMPRIRTEYDRNPAKMPFDFPELIASLSPRAFFASAPMGDTNFDVRGVRECITGAMPAFARVHAAERLSAIYPDAGHEFPEAARKEAYAWLDRWLRRN